MMLERIISVTVEKCQHDITEIVSNFVEAKKNFIEPLIEEVLSGNNGNSLANIIPGKDDQEAISKNVTATINSHIKFLDIDLNMSNLEIDWSEIGFYEMQSNLQNLRSTLLTAEAADWLGYHSYKTVLDKLIPGSNIIDLSSISREIWDQIAFNPHQGRDKIQLILFGLLENIRVKLVNHYSYIVAECLYQLYDNTLSSTDSRVPHTA